MQIKIRKEKEITLEDLNNRLGNVESTLHDILENGEHTREEFNERLIDIKDEMEVLNHNVKKVKAKMDRSTFRPATIMFGIVFVLVMWTVILHIY
jgi:ABC-type multidrug transport system fused ATPase/permease subunit